MSTFNLAPPTPSQAAAALVVMIEGGVAPSNQTLQQFAAAMGGTASMDQMTPEGRLLYLLALAMRSQ